MAFAEFLKIKMHAFARPVHPWIYDKQFIASGEPEGRLAREYSTAAERGGAVDAFSGAETHTRSVLKAVSWRTLGTLDTFAISWFMTGRVEIAGSIAGMEIVTKVIWYYLHERIWAIIPWGRRHYLNVQR